MLDKTTTNSWPEQDEFLQEELREEHLQLERIISREKRLRKEAEGLLEGLRTLNASRNSQEMFEELLNVLNEFIPIEDGFIIFEQADKQLIIGMTTNPQVAGITWESSDFLQRILAGKVIAAHDVSEIPAWKTQLKHGNPFQAASALHAPLSTQTHQAILVFTHSSPAMFNKKHVQLLEKFSPLTNQALINIEHKQELKSAVHMQTKKLRAAKESAEAANKAKSSFLANMSHEIRTPLNAIINFNTLALEGNIPSTEREYIEKVACASKGLLGIINGTLDLSKIEAGKLSIESIPFNLDKVIKEVIDLLSITAEEKGLSFNASLSYPKNVTVSGDPLRLRQILTNLIHNAIKFTDSGGIDFSVNAKPIRENSTAISFTISDSGIGLPADELKNIFDSFQQADNSTTRKFGGTGLGLAISKQLLELMGSEIEVKSIPNVGSKFFFTLELVNSEEDKMIDHQTLSKTDKIEQTLTELNPNILLVEDNITNQLIAKKILARINLNTTIANNGEEALIALENQEFDLILMDLHMPVLDGFQTTEAIRLKPQWEKLPIIALTANAIQTDVEQCAAAGMNAHIPKPIDIQTMYKVILDVLKLDGTP